MSKQTLELKVYICIRLLQCPILTNTHSHLMPTLCVCVCVCVCVCRHECASICMCVHACMHACMRECVRVWACYTSIVIIWLYIRPKVIYCNSLTSCEVLRTYHIICTIQCHLPDDRLIFKPLKTKRSLSQGQIRWVKMEQKTEQADRHALDQIAASLHFGLEMATTQCPTLYSSPTTTKRIIFFSF